MTKFTISLAEVNISVTANYESTREFCKEYIVEAEPDFAVTVSEQDIAFEREKTLREAEVENLPAPEFTEAYLETIALYRKIADTLIHYDTFLFHGSVVAVDGQAYLFTATSGTGKSTHTRIWRKVFKERAFMVNDDKPLLRVYEDGVRVCGTPWDGKHRLSTNIIVPLKGICILERGETNTITPITPDEALPMLLQQCHRPASTDGLFSVLGVMDRLMKCMKFYRLRCTISPNAARTAFEMMSKG